MWLPAATCQSSPAWGSTRGCRPATRELRRLYADADLFVLPTRGEARHSIGALLGSDGRCREIGAAARAKAEREFDSEINMRRILDVLAEVAERG